MSSHASMNSTTSTSSQQIELSQSHTEYEVAIQAVMEILQEYDSDQLFPAFGFGAKVSSAGKLSHRYPLKLVTTSSIDVIRSGRTFAD
ncbi:Copine-9 [Schistosoma japonicum]|nr:Copine-9 [Schistosoma japonicum]